MSLIQGSIFNPPKAQDSSANGSTGTSTNSSSSTATTIDNTLDANSFITLLTTELQSQDPTNPIDPTQFVDQLTDLNSLQELIQIRSDLDSLVGDTTAAASGSESAGTTAPTSNALSATPLSTAGNAVSSLQTQSATSVLNSLSSLRSLVSNTFSASPGAAASIYAKQGSLSKIL